MKKSKLLSIYLTICIMLLIISGSIAAVILFRPFYYLHIGMLDLVNETGWNYQTIKTAYDEMMNFCIGISPTFSTGTLAYSQEGMQHFVDCRGLFIFDFIVCIISSLSIIAYIVLHKMKKIDVYHFNNHNCGYYSATILLFSFISISLFASTDFNRAFTLFHKLFFPGKDNWIFNPYYDQIIEVLPEVFFMNCAIAIVSLLFISCICLIVKDYKNRLYHLN